MKKDIFEVIHQHQVKATQAAAEELEGFASALRSGRAIVWLWRFVLRQYWLWTVIGALVLGLGFPIILVLWNNGIVNNLLAVLQDPSLYYSLDWERVDVMIFGAVVLCGPIAMFLALAVYRDLYIQSRREDAKLGEVARRGVIAAVLLAFLNVPGYLVFLFLDANAVSIFIKVPMLFIVAGASCGLWIAWQAWRETHKDAPFFPRYSLIWMLALMLCWAGLLAVFAPAGAGAPPGFTPH